MLVYEVSSETLPNFTGGGDRFSEKLAPRSSPCSFAMEHRGFSRMGTLDGDSMREQLVPLPPQAPHPDDPAPPPPPMDDEYEDMAEQSGEDESDDYEIISDEYTDAGEMPPQGPTSTDFNVAGELCSGMLKKYASGNLMSKWQARFVRVVSYDTNGKSLILEYAKSQKAFLKADKVHKAYLKAPGMQELSAMGEAPWISKIGGDKTLCCEVFVSKRQHSGGKEHKGGHLVFKFENQNKWKNGSPAYFHFH